MYRNAKEEAAAVRNHRGHHIMLTKYETMMSFWKIIPHRDAYNFD